VPGACINCSSKRIKSKNLFKKKDEPAPLIRDFQQGEFDLLSSRTGLVGGVASNLGLGWDRGETPVEEALQMSCDSRFAFKIVLAGNCPQLGGLL